MADIAIDSAEIEGLILRMRALMAREENILTPNWKWFKKGVHDFSELEISIYNLGHPLIVKPSDEGSTVGLTIVKSPKDIGAAMELAFTVSDQLIFED